MCADGPEKENIVNNCVFIGWLVADPEITSVGARNTPKCTFRISVKRRTAQQGQQDADFFTVETWGKSAENCAKYLAKGRAVAVRGQMHTDSYTGTDGQKHYKTYLTADLDRGVEFLPSGSGQQQSGQHASAPVPPDAAYPDYPDEPPF